jgi:hypothetical protein
MCRIKEKEKIRLPFAKQQISVAEATPSKIHVVTAWCRRNVKTRFDRVVKRRDRRKCVNLWKICRFT